MTSSTRRAFLQMATPLPHPASSHSCKSQTSFEWTRSQTRAFRGSNHPSHAGKILGEIAERSSGSISVWESIWNRPLRTFLVSIWRRRNMGRKDRHRLDGHHERTLAACPRSPCRSSGRDWACLWASSTYLDSQASDRPFLCVLISTLTHLSRGVSVRWSLRNARYSPWFSHYVPFLLHEPSWWCPRALVHFSLESTIEGSGELPHHFRRRAPSRDSCIRSFRHLQGKSVPFPRLKA